jgi:hypothetical protein
MTNEQVMEFWQRRPFQPFDIRVSEGRVYTVDHPDFLARSRGGTFVTYMTEDDRVIIIDLGHVTALEVSNTHAA